MIARARRAASILPLALLCVPACHRPSDSEEPIVDVTLGRPADSKGHWRISWNLQGQMSGKDLDCNVRDATSVVAHVRTLDENKPRRRQRFRLPCATPNKEGFMALDPGRYEVQLELMARNGKTLSTTSAGRFEMPASGAPQATSALFQVQDGIIVKADNQPR